MEVTSLKGIGEILKKEREAQKITLEQVEETTKIRRKYLEAIEREAFEVLPGEV
ncbi:MAG: helix-turn-helix domain-containing protein, partial [Peptococcaceae bacterium]|nr:helix-turn-helix domain-containing protein [Peptococcaceae bacterium]